MPQITYRAGVVLVLLAGLLWSAMGLVIRLIDAGTWQILLWRSVGLVPVLFVVIALRSRGAPLARMRAAGMAGLVGGVALVVAFAGAIFAIQATTVANAVFLFAASPLLTALLSRLVLGEAVRRATWAAIALAGLGMYLMVREGLALGAGWGNLAALLSAAGFAVFSLSLRRGRAGDMLPAVMIGGLLSIGVAAAVLVAGGAPILLPARDLLLALAMGAVILGGGMWAYTTGSRAVPAAELTLLTMLEVLMAPVWVFLFLGETASAGTFLGGSVLLGAILINAFSGFGGRAGQAA